MPTDSIEDLRARISELEGKLAEAEQRSKEYAGQCAEQQHRIRNALQALSLLLSAQARTTGQPEFCLRDCPTAAVMTASSCSNCSCFRPV